MPMCSFEGAPQAVVDHRVDDLAVAHAQALATRGSRYGQLLIDSMPPATATSMSPVCDALRREHHGLQPRAADLVDRERADVVRQAAVERRLARRVLAEPGGHDVAHDAFVDDVAGSMPARATASRTTQRAELGRGEVFQARRGTCRSAVRTAQTMTGSRMTVEECSRLRRLPTVERRMRYDRGVPTGRGADANDQPTTDGRTKECRAAPGSIRSLARSRAPVDASTVDDERAFGVERDVVARLIAGADGRLPGEAHLGVGERLPAKRSRPTTSGTHAAERRACAGPTQHRSVSSPACGSSSPRRRRVARIC